MVLKHKYLFSKKNFIRNRVRKLKQLIKLYNDYIEYIAKLYREKVDKNVLNYKTKQYQKFQRLYYDYGPEKEIFDVVKAKKIAELKKEYRLKFRVFREKTRRKIASLEKKGGDISTIEALKQSIVAKEKELETKLETIIQGWDKEFELASSKRLLVQAKHNVSLDPIKEEIETSIANYRKAQTEKYKAKTERKTLSLNKKIDKYTIRLSSWEKALEKASNEYTSYAAKEREIAKQKELKKAMLELDKYESLLKAATTSEDKEKYEKILVTVKDKVDALNKDVPSIQDLIKDDEVLAINELCMFFGGIKAVNKLSFSVKEKEIFGLIGPNGAGKTTVFNCITQFYKPTSGQLAFKNKEGEIVDLTKEVVHNVILQGIVRTFQNLEVIKEVTVLDNLLIAAHRSYTSNLFDHIVHSRILHVEENVIRERAIKVLDFMGLLKYKDFLAWGLPYGILKKIEIARTLMCDPQLIILDEPAAGLNDSETVELASLIRKIRDKYNATILLVEHDMGLVMDVCDRICAISFGNLLALGTPKEIQSNKAVQEAYLGVSED